MKNVHGTRMLNFEKFSLEDNFLSKGRRSTIRSNECGHIVEKRMPFGFCNNSRLGLLPSANFFFVVFEVDFWNGCEKLGGIRMIERGDSMSW